MKFIAIKVVELTDRVSVAKSEFESEALAVKDCHAFMAEHINGANHLSASAVVLDSLCQTHGLPMQWEAE